MDSGFGGVDRFNRPLVPSRGAGSAGVTTPPVVSRTDTGPRGNRVRATVLDLIWRGIALPGRTAAATASEQAFDRPHRHGEAIHSLAEEAAVTNVSTTAEAAPQAGPRAHGLTGLVRRRPITAFLVVIFAVAWPALGIPRLAGHSVPPDRLDLVLSALAFVLLFGTALAVTAVTDGRSGVRRLLAGLVRWRIGVGRWLLAVAALPTLTLIIAAATGTLRTPPEGWWQMTVTYLLTGLVGGTLRSPAPGKQGPRAPSGRRSAAESPPCAQPRPRTAAPRGPA
jgi:hypothetical protein